MGEYFDGVMTAMEGNQEVEEAMGSALMTLIGTAASATTGAAVGAAIGIRGGIVGLFLGTITGFALGAVGYLSLDPYKELVKAMRSLSYHDRRSLESKIITLVGSSDTKAFIVYAMSGGALTVVTLIYKFVQEQKNAREQ